MFGQASVYLSKYLISFKLGIRFDETKNPLYLPKPTADTRKIQSKLTTVGFAEKLANQDHPILSRSESESCNVSTFHLFLVYLKFSSNLTP